MNKKEHINQILELVDRSRMPKSRLVDFSVLRTLLNENLPEQLIIANVVASLLCVDSDGLSFITEGETYNLLEESDTLYKITDDDGDEFWYDKKHFVKNQD